MSARDEWEIKYQAQSDADADVQQCALCGRMANKRALDRHHTRGRHGAFILTYIYLCRSCHRWVHANVREATERGLLIPNR